MFKQLTLAATLLATTAFAAPASANNYCAGGSFGMSVPALCTGNGYTPERAKATKICKAEGFNGVRQVGNGWQCTSHRSNYTLNSSVFTF